MAGSLLGPEAAGMQEECVSQGGRCPCKRLSCHCLQEQGLEVGLLPSAVCTQPTQGHSRAASVKQLSPAWVTEGKGKVPSHPPNSSPA